MILASFVLALSLTPAAAQANAGTKTATAPSNSEPFDAVQSHLYELLGHAPTMATAIAHDPSLLGESGYIAHNNPPLAAFLTAHPDIARTPEYYLFANLSVDHGDRARSLEERICPQMLPPNFSGNIRSENLVPMIVLPALFGAIVWIIYLFVTGLRQSKLLKAQSALQGRLIDKISSSQDMATYLSTNTAQKLFGGTSLTDAQPADAKAVFTSARILWPLQIGVMLIVLAIGVYGIRNCGNAADMVTTSAATALSAMMVAAGIGFILCAGIAWATAKRLGVLPAKPKKSEDETLDRP
jgi:hypothetical protein